MVAASRSAVAALGLCAAALSSLSFVPGFGVSIGRARSSQLQLAALRGSPAEVSFSTADIDAVAPEAQTDALPSMLRWVGAGLTAGLLAAAVAAPANAAIETAPVTKMKNLKTGTVEVDQTKLSVKSWGHMEPCGKNKKFQKRIKDEAFKLKKRQDKYAKGSAAYAGVQEVIDQAKATAAAYEGRWCGKKDGLPRVIATGEVTRGGIVTPALMFLYTTGWIGYAGRSYLLRTKDAAKEIKIDVPLALTCMTSAFAWPVYSWQDITNGRFVAKDTEIRVQRMHMA